MKIFKNFMWALLPIMSVVLFAACEDDPEPTQNPNPNAPAINLAKDVVEVRAGGGEINVSYTLTNAVDGVTITATPSVEWVTANTSIAGIIKLDVAFNEGEAREAAVEVSYDGAASKNITIKQAAKDTNTSIETADFYVELASADYREYYMNVYPKNKEAAYIVMSATPDYIEEMDLQEDQALFMDDMEWFDTLGMWNGKTIEDVLKARVKYGDQLSIKIADGNPDSEYIFYCYHVDIESKELVSPIARITVRTKAFELGEQEFSVKMHIDGPFVHVEEIYPKGTYSGFYYFDFFRKSDIDASGMTPEKYVESYFNYMASDELMRMLAPSTISICENRCSMGKDSYSAHLLANTDYYLASFAVDNLAICSTVPQIDIFQTGNVEPSDMQILIDVTNVGPYGASLTMTIDKTDYYVSGYAETDYYESLGTTDEERRDYLISHVAFEYINYSHTDNLTNLTPNTDYTAFAFGAVGGVPTTDLVRVDFTTASDEPSEYSISIRDLGYFDSDEVGALLPAFSEANSCAIFPIDVIVEPEGASSTYYWGMWLNDPFGDDYANYIGGLLYDGPRPQWATYTFDWDQLVTFAAIVSDEQTGQYSELLKITFTATKDQAGDAQDFVDWYNSKNNTSVAPASIVINDAAEQKCLSQNVTRANAANVRKVGAQHRERYAQDVTPVAPQRLNVE